jgi:hypothetical protein
MLPYPQKGNYPEYYENYFRLIDPHKDLIQIMHEDAMQYKSVIESIPDQRLSYAYADGKWTAASLIQHIIDTERIMTYRALCIARGDKTPLPGFDENHYAENAAVLHKPKALLALEWFSVRQASLSFYMGLSPEEMIKTGIANNNLVSVTANAYVTVGHARHHFNVLHQKYL